MLGRRQAVSHGFLEPAFGGSNPPAPARYGLKRDFNSFALASSCAASVFPGHVVPPKIPVVPDSTKLLFYMEV